jgi:tRNA pseudouridine32 synthase/23S rRNA pseudouridine746 synthase
MPAMEPPCAELTLLHAADGLLVFDKPAGLLCQPGLGPHQADSLITRVQCHWPEARLVHRLDRDTSGLLLVALDAALHRQLSALFAERRIRKTYLATVRGRPVRPSGRITLAIAKRQHRPPLYGPQADGKASCTLWRRWGEGPVAGSSRLVLQPLTGRSHQLRVHLQAIGHPILGDPLYGVVEADRQAVIPRLHLHAAGLRFRHPTSATWLRLRAPCPF